MELEPKGTSVFDDIYDKYAESVYRTAMKYSDNHHIAEEIVQEAFLKLYLHRENVNVDAAGKWLSLTTKYMALNYIRDHAREILLEDVIYDDTEKLILEDDPGNILFDRIKDEKRAKLLDDIFGALYRKSPRWYEAVTITYILGKPQQEVVDELGITLEVLHSILYRAKRWIRKNYEERYKHLDSL